jgi:RhoGAP domain/PH domain/SH3 domain
MSAHILVKIQFPPGVGRASSKIVKLEGDWTVGKAVEEIVTQNKLYCGEQYRLYRLSKDGWLSMQSDVSSFNFEPKETLCLHNKHQLIKTVAYVNGSLSTSQLLYDFEVPLAQWQGYIKRKCKLLDQSGAGAAAAKETSGDGDGDDDDDDDDKGDGGEIKLGFYLREKDVSLDVSKSLMTQQVDPNYCTLCVHNADEDIDLVREAAGGGRSSTALGGVAGSAASSQVNLEASIKELVDVVTMGPLVKMNRKKKWERRWFVLSQQHLFCYRSQSDSKPTGAVPLRGYQVRLPADTKRLKLVIELFSDDDSLDSGSAAASSSSSSSAASKQRSVYVMRAQNEPAYDQWVQALHAETGRPIVRPDDASGGGGGGADDDDRGDGGLIFGGRLESACAPGQLVPKLVRDAIKILEERALKLEGVFRLSGSAQSIANYAERFNAAGRPGAASASDGDAPDLSAEQDAHTVAGVLKQYFRDLDEPILPYDTYEDFLAADAALQVDSAIGIAYTKQFVDALPDVNRETLKFLVEFLERVRAHAHVNQTAAVNLATVFGPNLLKKRGADRFQIMESTAQVNSVVHTLIVHHKSLFGGADVPARTVHPKSVPSAVAKFDFPGDNAGELPLAKGDIVSVLAKGSGGWWRGEHDGRFGKYPAQYVAAMSQDRAARAMRKLQYERRMQSLTESLTAVRKRVNALQVERRAVEDDVAALQSAKAELDESAGAVKQRLSAIILDTALACFVERYRDAIVRQQGRRGDIAKLHDLLGTEVGTLHGALLSQPAGDTKLSKKKQKSVTANIAAVREASSSLQSRIQAEKAARRQLNELRKTVLSDLRDVNSIVEFLADGVAPSQSAIDAGLGRKLVSTASSASLALATSAAAAASSASLLPLTPASASTAAPVSPRSPRKKHSSKKDKKKDKKSKKSN